MSDIAGQPVHATLIAARRSGLWCGALLRGPSGAGKSDLALRALAIGWALVADDRVRVWTSGGIVYGCAPKRLSGLVEARGLGVVCAPALPFARIALVAETQSEEGERTPEPAWARIGDVALPHFHLRFSQPAAPVRLALALDAALRRQAPL